MLKVDDKVKSLRRLMDEKGIKAYVILTSDPHQSEYVADYYKDRSWISGFTGSAGIVIITQDEAILWTDGRYFIQAEKELAGSEFKLYKMNTPGYPTYTEYLHHKLGDGDTIGFNGKVFDELSFEKLELSFKDKDINFAGEFDLVGDIWVDRPSLPNGKAFILDEKYTGKSTKEKLIDLRNELNKKEADYLLLGSLDDIAWLYNIRGRDVECNPIIISYALITKDEAYLFVEKDKINAEVEEFLKINGVKIYSYDEVIEFVKEFKDNTKVLLDKNRINRWLYSGIPSTCKVIDEMNITTKLKGIKNHIEIENQKNAYIKDGVALTKFLYWLDKNIGNIEITEISAQEKMDSLREELDLFIGPSFGTISAYGPNAAMAHYSATEDSNAILEPRGFYLVDSGGQYLDGTTDTTRTISLGPITEEEKKDFTLTLKGHINLSDAKFLEGTNGYQLDIICRYPLWQEGLDYKHGTGHGIGFLLNVHEGPHRIASAPNDVALEEGMIVSIEPGVYKVGKHGIRIENIVVVEKDIKTESGQFMKFETLSLAPIDLDAIDISLLTEREKAWLNNYHKDVYNKLSPSLNEEEKEWLEGKTKAV